MTARPRLGDQMAQVSASRRASFLLEQAASQGWSSQELRKHAIMKGALDDPRLQAYVSLLAEQEAAEQQQRQRGDVSSALGQLMPSAGQAPQDPMQVQQMAGPPVQQPAELQPQQMPPPPSAGGMGDPLSGVRGGLPQEIPQHFQAPPPVDAMAAQPTGSDLIARKGEIAETSQRMALELLQRAVASGTMDPMAALDKSLALIKESGTVQRDLVGLERARLEAEQKEAQRAFERQQQRQDAFRDRAITEARDDGTILDPDGLPMGSVGLDDQVRIVPGTRPDRAAGAGARGRGGAGGADDDVDVTPPDRQYREYSAMIRGLLVNHGGERVISEDPELRRQYLEYNGRRMVMTAAKMLHNQGLRPNRAIARAESVVSTVDFDFQIGAPEAEVTLGSDGLPVQQQGPQGDLALATVTNDGKLNLANPLVRNDLVLLLSKMDEAGLTPREIIDALRDRYFRGAQ